MRDYHNNRSSTRPKTLFCVRGHLVDPLSKSTSRKLIPEAACESTVLRCARQVLPLHKTRVPRDNLKVISKHGSPDIPKPSHTINQDDTLKLSPATMANLERALDGGIARSTAQKYDGAVREFNSFCDSEAVPLEQRLPASELLLCAFAARYVGLHAESTIRSSLLGLRSLHINHGFEWQGGPRLARVLRAARLHAPPSSKRPLRPPATAQLVAKIVIGLSLSDPFDAAVAAIITTALWGMASIRKKKLGSVVL